MNHLGLTWRDVLDCYKGGRAGNTIEQFIEKVVEPSGYTYFSWNGKVYHKYYDLRGKYKVIGYSDTGIFAAELE